MPKLTPGIVRWVSIYTVTPIVFVNPRCMHMRVTVVCWFTIQVLWGGRWQPNSAAGAGEEMEQLFSYLSRFNLTTKYMNAAGMRYCFHNYVQCVYRLIIY